MEHEQLQQVAFIALRNADGSFMPDVPLYVKVSDVNQYGVTDEQEELIRRISRIMIRRYEKEISEFMCQLKNTQKKIDSG